MTAIPDHVAMPVAQIRELLARDAQHLDDERRLVKARTWLRLPESRQYLENLKKMQLEGPTRPGLQRLEMHTPFGTFSAEELLA